MGALDRIKALCAYDLDVAEPRDPFDRGRASIAQQILDIIDTEKAATTPHRDALFAEWDRASNRPSTLRSIGFRRGLEFAIKVVDPEFYANEIADDDEEQP
jgi:hypothetical protein